MRPLPHEPTSRRAPLLPCPHRPIVVAIPARNEADELEDCLFALAAQRPAAIDCLVVCLNNCTDGSAAVIRRIAVALPFCVDVVEVTLPPDRACAGMAR